VAYFLQQLINGLQLGFVYALIALGYTMVYGIVRLINFAHGDVFMVGAYVGFYALASWKLPWPLAIIAAMVGCGALGMFIERVAYRPLRSAPRISALITAMGVSLFLEYFTSLRFVFGPDYRFEPARVLSLRMGADVLLVSTGQQSARTLAAADLLAADGIDAGVLHVPSIKPVDAGAIAAAAAAVALVVTTEEHSVLGGLGGLVAEIVTAHVPRRVERIGIEDMWGESAPNAWLLDRHGLTPERVAERVRRVLEAG